MIPRYHICARFQTTNLCFAHDGGIQRLPSHLRCLHKCTYFSRCTYYSHTIKIDGEDQIIPALTRRKETKQSAGGSPDQIMNEIR